MAKKRIEGGITINNEYVGEPFYRKPDRNLPFRSERHVRIMEATDETGDTVFIPVKKLPPTIVANDFPHHRLSEVADEIDQAFTPTTLTNTRKEGASIIGTDMNTVYESRNGDHETAADKTGGNFMIETGYRPKKDKGHFLKTTTEELSEERKRKKQM